MKTTNKKIQDSATFKRAVAITYIVLGIIIAVIAYYVCHAETFSPIETGF